MGCGWHILMKYGNIIDKNRRPKADDSKFPRVYYKTMIKKVKTFKLLVFKQTKQIHILFKQTEYCCKTWIKTSFVTNTLNICFREGPQTSLFLRALVSHIGPLRPKIYCDLLYWWAKWCHWNTNMRIELVSLLSSKLSKHNLPFCQLYTELLQV